MNKILKLFTIIFTLVIIFTLGSVKDANAALDPTQEYERENGTGYLRFDPNNDDDLLINDILIKGGLIKGNGNGDYGFGWNFNRQELAVIMSRLKGEEHLAKNYKGKLDSVDAHAVDKWAYPYMAYAKSKGWMIGDTMNRMNPKGWVSYREAYLAIYRQLGWGDEVNWNNVFHYVYEDYASDYAGPNLYKEKADPKRGDLFYNMFIILMNRNTPDGENILLKYGYLHQSDFDKIKRYMDYDFKDSLGIYPGNTKWDFMNGKIYFYPHDSENGGPFFGTYFGELHYTPKDFGIMSDVVDDEQFYRFTSREEVNKFKKDNFINITMKNPKWNEKQKKHLQKFFDKYVSKY